VAVVSVPTPAGSSATGTPAEARAVVSGRDAPGAPQGYVEMTVGDVTSTGEGHAVLLVDESSDVVVPIFIGPNEAMAIDLRHRKQRYQRPLTHDLLDSILHELGGSLVKVQIDDIKDNTFVGAVFVRTATRVVELDARPSDAIALALGNHVPIFVARQVIDRAGVHRGDRSAPPGPSDRSRL
jgi:bifunctional DNase/RNase